MGDGKLGKGVFGFYKWDSTPDKVNRKNTEESARLYRMPSRADQLGLKNAAAYLRKEAEKEKNK